MSKQSDEDLRDDATADGPETVAGLPHVRFAEQVVPQWCLTAPSGLGRADFVLGQRLLAQSTSDILAGRQADSFTTLEVSHGQRVKFVDLACTRKGYRKSDERSDEATINPLCTLRRRTAGHVEQLRPVNAMRRVNGLEPEEIGKKRYR
jgi:hypothetical protein